jgi:hypothetical protein
MLPAPAFNSVRRFMAPNLPSTNFSGNAAMSTGAVLTLSPRVKNRTRRTEKPVLAGQIRRIPYAARLHEKLFICVTPRPESPILAAFVLSGADHEGI